MSLVQIKDKLTDEQVLGKITMVFQSHSYDAINTDQISCETGISATELRRWFPDGKKQMVNAILQRVESHFRHHILAPLSSTNEPLQRVDEMTERLKDHYLDGFGSCLLETLSIGNCQDEYKTHVTRLFNFWCNALITVACESGFTRIEAHERAEQALVSIEGSLVFARITGNNKPFLNSLNNLATLLIFQRKI
ncbi:MAG: TetR/AcrR family transcriptional regulator [Gammaproteobacteria bacterium]